MKKKISLLLGGFVSFLMFMTSVYAVPTISDQYVVGYDGHTHLEEEGGFYQLVDGGVDYDAYYNFCFA